MESKFKKGDTVRVKSWAQMCNYTTINGGFVTQYDISPDKFTYCFTDDMEHTCGEYHVIRSVEVLGEGERATFKYTLVEGGYDWEDWMLEAVE